jgi:hypothetical protein
MAVENQGKSPRKPLPKKLGKVETKQKINPQTVVEQVPDWLTQLLKKYGETIGPLIGLEEAPFEPVIAPAEIDETDQLSVLLNQMGEEGLEEEFTARGATSVEWGSHADMAAEEIPLASMDDLLSNLAGEPQGYRQDEFDEQTPAWITDTFSAETEFESGYQGTQPQTELAGQEDTPDWLNEIIPTPPQPTSSTSSTIDEEAPDWLESAFGSRPEPPGVTSPPEPAASTIDEDIPDWLMEALDTSAPATPKPMFGTSPQAPFAVSVSIRTR